MALSGATARAFVAFTPGPAARARLGAALQELSRSGGDVRWVAPDKLHVTLRFLGDLDRERLARVEQELAEVRSPALELGLGAVGQFPPRGRPRVLWVGLSGGHRALTALGDAVEAAVRRAGLAAERRPFRQHLTLARVRGPRGLHEALDAFAALDLRSPPEAIEHITLYESELRADGARHTALRDFPLGGQP